MPKLAFVTGAVDSEHATGAVNGRRVVHPTTTLYWAGDSAQARIGTASDAMLDLRYGEPAPGQVLPGMRGTAGSAVLVLWDGAP